MFRYQVNSGSLNLGIKEKIEVSKISNFFIVLNKKLANYRIIIIRIIVRKIIESHTGLKIQSFTEHVLRIVKRVSGQKFGNVKNIILLVCLLIQKRIV